MPASEPKSTKSRETSRPGNARARLPAWLPAVLLALMTIALYWPATRHEFISYDDNVYVTENPHVTGGITCENIAWAFRTGHAANWHPVTWLSHMLDCQVFGLKPAGPHLINLLLHALNAVLVFTLLRQMTGAMWRSFTVAALFAVHPLHVESVAWVAERKDVLSACFGLLALIFYARFVQTSNLQPPTSKIFYWSSLLFFALGLMSKPMLVTLPFVMLLLDYWPLCRSVKCEVRSAKSDQPSTTCPAKPWRRRINYQPSTLWPLVMEKIPFIVLAAAASIVTFMVQKQAGAVLAVENFPAGARSANALISYCRYLGKLFWPARLAVFHPFPPQHWPPADVLLAGGLLAALSALVFWRRRRHPFLLMGWLWFVGTLTPVIGLVQAGSQSMADRYAYIPLLGVLIMVVWWGCELAGRRPRLISTLVVGAAAAIILYAVFTRQQLGYWQDDETLFQHALEVTENNWVAHTYLGADFYKNGRMDEAIAQFQEAIRRQPDYFDAHNNLALAFDKKGRTDEAIVQYQEAIRLKPDSAEARNNLGADLDVKGQTDEAIVQYREAIRLKPGYADAHYNLGLDLDDEHKIAEAIDEYQEAIRLKPDHAQARYNLGNAFFKEGRINDAISQYQEAIRLKPDYAEACNNLGSAFFKNGRIDEAISEYQEAIRIKPDFDKARQNLARAESVKNTAPGR